jgi:hypothetical protein
VSRAGTQLAAPTGFSNPGADRPLQTDRAGAHVLGAEPAAVVRHRRKYAAVVVRLHEHRHASRIGMAARVRERLAKRADEGISNRSGHVHVADDRDGHPHPERALDAGSMRP